LKYLALATLALLLGFAIGWAANAGSSAPDGVAVQADNAETVAAPVASDAERDARSSNSAIDPPRVARAAGGLISNELARYARDEIAVGWLELRKDPIPDATRERGFGEFEEILKRTPREIGRKLAERQNDEDSLASGDIFSILAALDREDLGPQPEIVRNQERFQGFFKCARGATLDGPSAIADRSQSLGDSATLVFGPGIHVLGSFLQDVNEAPRCLEVAGAGIDRTLLVLGDISVRGPVDRFSIRDCTVFTGDRYLFDLRSVPSVVELERAPTELDDLFPGWREEVRRH